MNCSCQTAALRIFVRNIAQIHVPLSTATPRLAQNRLLYGRPSPFRSSQRTTVALAATPSRTFHVSSARNGAAELPHSDQRETSRASEQQDTTELKTSSHDAEWPEAHRDAAKSGHRNAKPGEEESNKSEKKATKGKKEKKASQPEQEDEDDTPRPKKEPWMIQKEALKKKFPEGWKPRKRLSPDALTGIRALHAQFPEEYTTEVLAQKFEVSPEAIRRILKSKWNPTPEEEMERQERWFKRGKKVWAHWAALGKKPPRRWRAEGIVRDPYWNRPRGPRPDDRKARAEAQRKLTTNMMG
ncbi:hypothetical protein VTK56DRAFT_8756 [Thermocarpiscus australiensis]